MQLQIYTVDAFVDGPGSGNPAGVCLLGPEQLGGMTDTLRQQVAAKVNLSETAFVEPASATAEGPEPFKTGQLFKLRWLTPTVEVPLCGHATLASAAVLYEACDNVSPAVSFETLSGPLVVKRIMDAQFSPLLQMSLPLAPPTDTLPPSLTTELVHNSPSSIGDIEEQPHKQQPGCAPDWTSQWLSSVVHYVGFAAPVKYLLVVLKPGHSGKQLAALQPDIAAMAEAVPASELIGVIVATGRGTDDEGPYDVYARFFGPWAGISEDPVTGSAYSVIAPYFSEHLPGGQQQMTAKQCSARGGTLQLDLGTEPGRVLVSGRANLGPPMTIDTTQL